MEQPFARYLYARRHRDTRLYLALLASSILWGAVLAGAISASYLYVPEVVPPPLLVQFLRSALLPPPPAAPAQRARSSAAPPVKPPVLRTLEQPRPAPPTAPTADAAEDEPCQGPGCDDDAGAPGSGPPCQGAACGPPCQGDACAAASAPPPPPPRPVLRPWIILKTDFLRGDLPHLPPVVLAQRRGTTVRGMYTLCIDQSGAVTKVTAQESIPGADEAIQGTLRTWQFKRQPIPVCFMRILDFVVE